MKCKVDDERLSCIPGCVEEINRRIELMITKVSEKNIKRLNKLLLYRSIDLYLRCILLLDENLTTVDCSRTDGLVTNLYDGTGMPCMTTLW